MARVLITGFEPRPGMAADSAADSVHILAQTWHGDGALIARGLVPAFEEAPRRLRASIARHLPDAVILVASRPGSAEITIERLAVNLDHADAPDAAGNRPVDVPVVPGAEAGLWTTLPTREILDALHARSIPARLSLSPTTDVANHVFYSLQRELAQWQVPSGLIHVPASPEMALGGPALPAEVIAEALRVVVEATVAVLEEESSTVTAVAPPAPQEDDARAGFHAEFDPEATQPFLMPIAEPIVEAQSRPFVPTLEPEPELEPLPALEPAPEPAPHTSPVAVAEPPAAADATWLHDHTDTQDAADTPHDDHPEPPPSRPLTWEEIITGGR